MKIKNFKTCINLSFNNSIIETRIKNIKVRNNNLINYIINLNMSSKITTYIEIYLVIFQINCLKNKE